MIRAWIGHIFIEENDDGTFFIEDSAGNVFAAGFATRKAADAFLAEHSKKGEKNMEYRTCTLCKQQVSTSDLLKYSVRHYAHLRCLRKAHKDEALKQILFSQIPVWRLKQIPYFEAKELGLLPMLRALLGHELEAGQ